MDAERETANMTPNQFDLWQQKQEADLLAVLDPEEIRRAEVILKKADGTIDLKKIARAAGALTALSLFHIAENKGSR